MIRGAIALALAVVVMLGTAAVDYRSTMKASDRTWCNEILPMLGGTSEPDASGMYPPTVLGPTCVAKH